MPSACCLFRSRLAYRRDEFCAGLEAAGYQIQIKPTSPKAGDVLLIWNRRGSEDVLARRYEKAGGLVIVAENGYVWPEKRKMYALALTHHNGAGYFREGDPDRWGSFGIEVHPWRKDGRHVLVLPQRGIGEIGVAMPPSWLNTTLRSLRTKRPVVVRHHPGDKSAEIGELANAWCAVTWGSGAAIKALVAGIPVFHCFKGWIGAPAAQLGYADLEAPWLGDRLPMLRRLAWAQWSIDEISSGEAFRWLLNGKT